MLTKFSEEYLPIDRLYKSFFVIKTNEIEKKNAVICNKNIGYDFVPTNSRYRQCKQETCSLVLKKEILKDDLTEIRHYRFIFQSLEYLLNFLYIAYLEGIPVKKNKLAISNDATDVGYTDFITAFCEELSSDIKIAVHHKNIDKEDFAFLIDESMLIDMVTHGLPLKPESIGEMRVRRIEE